MSARATMADLIADLRPMANVGESDYTVSGFTYWTDAQLQTVLDKYRVDVVDAPLHGVLEQGSGGTATYYRYTSEAQNFEKTDGGTALFVVKDSTWATVGTASYTADYRRGEIAFTTNTAGSAYYLTGRVYDLNRAAADVWRQKAAQVVSSAYSWSSDNMRVDKSAMRKEYLDMATYYEAQAGPQVVSLRRGDE